MYTSAMSDVLASHDLHFPQPDNSQAQLLQQQLETMAGVLCKELANMESLIRKQPIGQSPCPSTHTLLQTISTLCQKLQSLQSHLQAQSQTPGFPSPLSQSLTRGRALLKSIGCQARQPHSPYPQDQQQPEHLQYQENEQEGRGEGLGSLRDMLDGSLAVAIGNIGGEQLNPFWNIQSIRSELCPSQQPLVNKFTVNSIKMSKSISGYVSNSLGLSLYNELLHKGTTIEQLIKQLQISYKAQGQGQGREGQGQLQGQPQGQGQKGDQEGQEQEDKGQNKENGDRSRIKDKNQREEGDGQLGEIGQKVPTTFRECLDIEGQIKENLGAPTLGILSARTHSKFEQIKQRCCPKPLTPLLPCTLPTLPSPRPHLALNKQNMGPMQPRDKDRQQGEDVREGKENGKEGLGGKEPIRLGKSAKGVHQQPQHGKIVKNKLKVTQIRKI